MAKRKPKPSASMKLIEKKNEVKKLSTVYNQALKENASLENKVIAYMNSATMYRDENAYLRARCEEVEEMLRQTEGKLEISNKCTEEAEKEADTQREARLMLLQKLSECVKRKYELEETLKEEKAKTWWQKFKEGIKK